MPEGKVFFSPPQLEKRDTGTGTSTGTKKSITPSMPMRASKLHAAGMPKLYDPGLATTLAFKSSITYLNGAAGILRYRGYPIEELATKASFDEAAYLLLYKILPTKYELERFRQTLSSNSKLPPHVISIVKSFPTSTHPMTILVSALSSLAASYPTLNPAIHGQNVYSNNESRQQVISIVLGMLPTLASLILHHTNRVNSSRYSYQNEAMEKLSYTERFFKQAFPNLEHDKELIFVKALDILFLLHADHEQNCSTSAVRHLTSSGVDVFSSLSAGVSALYGPLHGGACEAVVHMLKTIGKVENIPKFIEDVKNRKQLLMGFGHRVYKTYDPRAKIVRQLVQKVLNATNNRSDPLIQIALRLEYVALNDQYFISRKLYPNIDFYSGIIYKSLNVNPSFFGIFFALGRSVGWLAHWSEFLDDSDRKIARPHQWFTGEVGPLRVASIDQRDHENVQERWKSAKL